MKRPGLIVLSMFNRKLPGSSKQLGREQAGLMPEAKIAHESPFPIPGEISA